MSTNQFSAYDFAKMVLKTEPSEYQKRILKALDSGEQIILSRRPSLRSTQMKYLLLSLLLVGCTTTVYECEKITVTYKDTFIPQACARTGSGWQVCQKVQCPEEKKGVYCVYCGVSPDASPCPPAHRTETMCVDRFNAMMNLEEFKESILKIQ